MAAVRRRRPARVSAEEGDEYLTQSLLDDEDVHLSGDYNEARKAIIVHPGPFVLDHFIKYVLEWWQRVLSTVTAYVSSYWPTLVQPTYSLLQAQKLEELKDKVAVRYNAHNTEHQDALKRLWSLGFPDLPCTVLKTPQWKEMGWQGEDPATDFRGAGFFGLENLLYLGEVHPGLFRQLLDKSVGRRAEWEYPFCVAGLNITMMLSQVLELQVPAKAPSSPAARSFLALVESNEYVFEELYCATFELLDGVWLDMKASYMEFNTVLKKVRAAVESSLVGRPSSVEAVCAKIRAGS